MTTTFENQSLIQLQYRAVYDPFAALEVSYIYLFNDQVSYDKYAAFIYYYCLYRELIKYPSRPLLPAEAKKISSIKQAVENKLKSVFYLNSDLQKTFKTSIRTTLSTSKYRNIYSWFISTQSTLLKINRFLVENNITQLDKILEKSSINTVFFPISEIAFELAIIAKNGIKCSYKDYYFKNGIDKNHIIYDMYLAFIKEGRRPRLFFASMWLGITIALVFFPAATGGLVIFGITVDLVFQAIRGTQELRNLTIECQFIQKASANCHTPEHMLLDSSDISFKSEYQKWLAIQEARLNLRSEHLSHARIKQKIKMAMTGSITILGMIGTGFSFYSVPNYKLLGLFISALSSTGSLGWKLIESLFSTHYKTQPAIPEVEKNLLSFRNENYSHKQQQPIHALFLTPTLITQNTSQYTTQSSSRSLESSSQELIPPVIKITNSLSS